jgi:hypothetical protein
MGQVAPSGNRSVNGVNESEATDSDLVLCVRFPRVRDQKQSSRFRPERDLRRTDTHQTPSPAPTQPIMWLVRRYPLSGSFGTYPSCDLIHSGSRRKSKTR